MPIAPQRAEIPWIFAALCLLPLIEIAGFVVVGEHLGVFGTLLAVILNSLFGGLVLRVAGLNAVYTLAKAREKGTPPPLAALESFFLILAGLLFILPGFATDLIALPLLLPPVRQWLAATIWAKLGAAQKNGTANPRFIFSDSSAPPTIEGEFREIGEDGGEGRR